MAFNTQEILKAMEIIAHSQVDRLNLDKTIVAQITDIVNLDIGEYKVVYEGNTFSAFANNPTITFEEGNSVYVKIPQNDMSQKKIIEGITSRNQSLTDIVQQQTAVNQIGPTWDKFYKYPIGYEKSFGVCAGMTEDDIGENKKGEINTYIYNREKLSDNEKKLLVQQDQLFQNYASKYKQIKISASFLTRFIGQHNKGNYGLIVTFNTKTGGKVSYRLDINSFVGQPYGYTTWSPQSVIIDVQENYLLGLDSILLFQENFDYDTSRNYDGESIITNKGDYNNILATNLELFFVELIDLTQDVYYLDIVTVDGITFTSKDKNNTKSELSLAGKLRYHGSDIMSNKTCQCYWYKEDLDITVGHENYSKLAGPRWQLIPEKAEESNIKANFNELVVKVNAVPYHSTYKLVVVYNKETTLNKEVTLYNADTNYDFALVQEMDGTDVYLKIQNNKEDKSLVGKWYYSLPDGSYQHIADADGKSSINISKYLLYTVVDFYCEVYEKDLEEIISVEHIVIQSSSQLSDVTVTYAGQEIYQYDANGDVSYEDTEIDRTLEAAITWKEGIAPTYEISWIAPDGTTLSQSKQNPANSMMQNLWVDKNNILHYNIRQKYRYGYNNNIVTLVITTIDNSRYEFKKEILFLKSGDQGTNGSTYSCVIRPVNAATGGKDIGLKALYCTPSVGEEDVWGDQGIDLRCFVYKDGDLINESELYSIMYEWVCGSQNKEVLTVTETEGKKNNQDHRTIKGQGKLDTNGDYVVKVTVTITPSVKENDSDRTILYYQYPIDIAVNSSNSVPIDLTKLEVELPSYIQYTASGVDPIYQNKALICKKEGEENATFSSTKSTLFQIKNIKEILEDGAETGKIKESFISPVDKFLYREGIGAIKCDFNDGTYLLHPVMMYLNTYGNETIDGWDGTRLEISDKGGYILAPQIGAGIKEDDNSFTGVLMGRQSGIENKDVFGLYGYNKGTSTFGFKEDGTGYIGASSAGQILFNGTNSTIMSSNYKKGEEGMMINLKEGLIESDKFKLSSENMLLDSSEQMFSFTLNSNSSLDNSKFLINVGEKTLFEVSKDSYYLKSLDSNSNVQIDLKEGTINVNNGTIGGWTITSNSLSSGDNITLRSNGTATIGGLTVDTDSTTITGTVNADKGYIGKWQISNGAIIKGDTILSEKGDITSKSLTIKYSDSNKDITLGTLGYVQGNDGISVTSAIGIKSEAGTSIIFESGQSHDGKQGNIALKAGKEDNGSYTGDIYLECNQLHFKAYDIYFEGNVHLPS